jgi:release factor glutamine methyltransferase
VKLFEAVKKAKEILYDSNTPQLDAEVILSHILDRDRSYLYLNRDMILNNDLLDNFFSMIERRKNGEPVQYITGHQEFMGLDFVVKPGVLIPRGDTEILVEEVLRNIKDMKNPIIVDVGCGSGAISVSVGKYKEDGIVYALDVMDTPIEVTNINAVKNGVGDRVHVTKSDLLGGLDKNLEKGVDAVVSNPPYIKEDVIKTLMKGVKDYEPREALSGGIDGLYFYREITRQAMDYLKENGMLAYEIGYDQRDEVMEILSDNGFKGVYCLKDLAGNDRAVIGWRR